MDKTDVRAMQSLAQEVWRLRPELISSEGSLGQLAWAWGAGHRRNANDWNARVWSEGGSTIAWGWIYAPMQTTLSDTERRIEPATLIWQAHPDHTELLDELLDWFTAEVPNDARQTAAREVDGDALARIEQHGYVRDADAPWGMLNIRNLDEIEEPRLPDGYRFLTMRELGSDVNSVARRVEAHRVAWAPSSLTAEAYEDTMCTPPYRDDLDFAVEADDGTLVASAIGWFDEANATAEFEPVGTHPDYRQRGLGRALLLSGMHRFKEAGATTALVGCRGDANYPIPKKLYRSVGFTELTRELRYVRSSSN